MPKQPAKPKRRDAVDDADGELSPLQWRFVAAFLGESCGNASDAARRAGMGRNLKEWENQARYCLTLPRVQRVIRQWIETSTPTPEAVLNRLTAFMNANISDFLKTDVNGIPILDEIGRPQFDLQKAAGLGKMHLIDKLTIDPDGRVSVTLPNRLEAAKVLAKYHGLLVDRIEIGPSQDDAAVRAAILDKLTAIAAGLDQRDQDILAGKALPATQGRAERRGIQ